VSNFHCKLISIDEIKLEDRTYLFSYPKRDTLLKESIKTWGLLQPPILFAPKDSSGKYQLISGEGRVLACKSLGVNSIPAYILSEKRPEELLLISLESNLFRPLNLVEKAEFIKRALKIFTLEQTLELLPKLNFSRNYIWIEFLQNINKLEDEFKNLLVQEKLHPKITQNLVKLNKEERKEFLKLIEKLNLTFSEQKDVLEKLIDYKKRKDLSFFLPDELREILKEEDFNRRKREFFTKLNELYYPSYSAKLKKVSPIVEKFRSKKIFVNFVPYFEKRELSIQFNAKNSEEISDKLKFLEENKKELEEILKEI